METVGEGARKIWIGMKERSHEAGRGSLTPGFNRAPDDGEGLAPTRKQRLLLHGVVSVVGWLRRRWGSLVHRTTSLTAIATLALALLAFLTGGRWTRTTECKLGGKTAFDNRTRVGKARQYADIKNESKMSRYVVNHPAAGADEEWTNGLGVCLRNAAFLNKNKIAGWVVAAYADRFHWKADVSTADIARER